MLLCAVSVLVVAQSSSEIPEGLMNNPVYVIVCPTRRCSSIPTSVRRTLLCVPVFILPSTTVAKFEHCMRRGFRYVGYLFIVPNAAEQSSCEYWFTTLRSLPLRSENGGIRMSRMLLELSDRKPLLKSVSYACN